MKIRTIAGIYKDWFGMIVRVYKDGEIKICGYACDLYENAEEYEALMNTTFKSFEGNGVAVHFYI